MAQDHSDTGGQQPTNGYDYQQPWYPQPEAAGDPWGGSTGYQTPYGTPDPQTAWQHQPATGDQQQWSQGYYNGATGYGYQDPYAQQTGEQQLYAPAGTEQNYGGYLPYQQETAVEPQAEPALEPAVETSATEGDAPFDPAALFAATMAAASAVDTSVDPAAAEREPAARRRGSSGGATGLVDRAKAAAEAVLSADHAPSRRALAIRAGAGVAALAVLITAGVLATGDDGKPASGADAGPAPQNISVAHDKAWTAQPAAAPAAGTDDTLVGSWMLPTALVRADAGGVQAYGLADGKPTWSVAAPAAGAVPCGLSPAVNASGLGAALFRTSADPKAPCSVVAAVDTKTGKTAWTKSLSDAAKPGYAAHVAVLDDKVVAVGDDKAAAWATADGKDLWQYPGPSQYCTLSGNAAGSTVLLHSSCADTNPGDQAVALNAADGKLKWWRGLNNQPKTVTVLSAEPAALLTTGATPTDDRVLAWGPNGDPAAEIPVSTDAGHLDATRGSFDPVPGVFFHEQTMIGAVTPADGGAPTVTAYDLTTGKSTWKVPVAEKAKARPVGVDSGGLLLAVDERLDKPAHISRFALTGGQETEGGSFPKGTGSLLTSGRLLSGTGKVIAVPEHSSNFGTATAFQDKG